SVSDIHGDSDTAIVQITVNEKPNYLPIANDDARATEYETEKTVDVLINDDGLNDGGIIVSIESESSNGSTSINGDNTITFTPSAEYSGITSFQYRLTDIDGDFSVATVTITVKEAGEINHIPDASNDIAETFENISVDINVLANDNGLEDGFGDILVFTPPNHGSVVINPNRTITYKPSTWFVGNDNFSYWVEDIDGDYDIATVNVSVNKEGNSVPDAFDDARATEYETPITVDVMINDIGLEDGGILVTIESESSNGSISVNGDNTIIFNPLDGYSGITSFQYRLTDIDGEFDIATVTITVKEDGEINYSPIANDDIAETVENTAVDINVIANDTGLEDGFGSLSIYTAPNNGTVEINLNRTVTYTPANSFIGNDSFEYWIEDVDGDYDIASVTVTVNEKPNYIPVANDDRRGTSFNTPVTVDALVNDTGLEDGGIIVSIDTESLNGTVLVNGDNTITFTPETDYIGKADFKYKVEDNDEEFDIATVTITVKDGTNIIPDAIDDEIITTMNQAISYNVLENDNGLDDGINNVLIYTVPLYGNIVVNANFTITYTPSPWFVGIDNFQYLVEDVDGDYDIASVTVTVNEKPNYIPVANDDMRGTSINSGVNVDVLTNDTGLEDGGIIVSVESSPSNGSLTVNADNTFTYTPAENYIGSDQFEYKLCDIDGDCDIASVIITVRDDNYVPIAVDDKFYTNVNSSKTIDVLSNDSNLDDGGINIEIISDIVVGYITVNEDNTITYVPLTGYEGTETFTYKVSDVDGDYDTANVTLEIMSGILPELNISALSGNTSEDGTTATFTLVLNKQPTADVFVDLNSDDLTEGTLSNNRLTFTTENWDAQQTVTITGVNDYVDDGDINYKIIIDNLISTDLSYNGLSVSNIDVVNIDDDEAGISVISGASQTGEDGTSTSIKFILNSQPISDVSLVIESDDISEGIIDMFDIIFTAENWSDTSEVIITGKDDNKVDGDILYNILISSATSTDEKYDGLNIDNISITNIDNDSKVLIFPEAFSPGNDGYNDFFEIVNLEHYDKPQIRIYNRWGSLVYSSDNYKNDWDGKSNVGLANASELPTGTYYYVLEINGNSKKKNGYIFIKR
ncbi:MAG: Ig-like domain-containing protein, partial [Bacteroidales bacterium]|nr:Ig-like domain-containing protein [Bacteroidales bacterium]